MYSIGKFANKIGVTSQTLRNWDRENKLKPIKVTEGGTRYYSEEQYLEYVNRFGFDISEVNSQDIAKSVKDLSQKLDLFLERCNCD